MDLNNINTCVPARIVSFDPVTQTASVKVCLDRIYSNFDQTAVKDTYPVLTGVPVHFPQGGGWSLTFPIAAGNDCIVVFSQRGYDHWLYDGKESSELSSSGLPTMTHKRSFDLTDGFALVGFNAIPRVITSFNAAEMELRNQSADQKITLKAGGDIEFTTPTQVTINAPMTQVNGDANVTGDVTIGGISFLGHVHGGVITGGDSTQAPQ